MPSHGQRFFGARERTVEHKFADRPACGGGGRVQRTLCGWSEQQIELSVRWAATGMGVLRESPE